MPFQRRLLVAHFGGKPTVHLIRYASMVMRLCQTPSASPSQSSPRAPARGEPRLATRVAPARQAHPRLPDFDRDYDPEVRFVSLVPSSRNDNQHACGTRAQFRARVNKYFRDSSERLSVGCDVLRGQSVRRLLAFADDFDSGLILVGDNGSQRRKLAQLASESACPIWTVPGGWAPVLRRILAPIDLADRALDSLLAAIELARRFPRAQCLAVHVDSQDTRFGGDALEPTRQRELQASFTKLMRRIDSAGVSIAPLFVKSHHPARAVVRIAQQHSPDLVVMATRGRTRLARALLPSVTEAVVRNCACATLVLKSHERPLGLTGAFRERLHTPGNVQFS
jgi:nucleotide-binding universal stress UspA family protein